MFEQSDPEQSCHWYAYEVGLPDHEPALAVSVLPSRGVPVIAGTAESTGGEAGGAGEFPGVLLAPLAPAPPAPPAGDELPEFVPARGAWVICKPLT
jgi:hypothetical protein